jgi:hypothetical protein
LAVEAGARRGGAGGFPQCVFSYFLIFAFPAPFEKESTNNKRVADDFVDVALVEHAVEKSRERVAVFLAKRDRAEEAESLRAESMAVASEMGGGE